MRCGRKAVAAVFFALLALVGSYNLLTGSWFITAVLFPAIGETIKYNLAAENIEISLLRGTIEIKDFRFGPGWEPIVVAPSITANFSRRALLHGRLQLYKVRATAPEVTVCRNQVGYYNVNKVRFAPRPPDPPGPTVFPEQPDFFIEAEDIKIKDGVFRFYYINNDGVNEIDIEARNVAISADRFGNSSDTNFTVDLLGKLSTYSLELNQFIMKLSCHAKFTPHLLPSFTAAVCDLTEISGIAGGVSLNSRTLHAEGEASGENVLNALQVKFINVDIADRARKMNTRIEVTGDLDFYPWLMTSTANFVPIDPELFNYFHNYLGIPLTDATLNSRNRFTLNYTDAVLDGNVSLAHDDDFMTTDYKADWEIETDKVTVARLSAELAKSGVSAAASPVASFSNLVPLVFNFDGNAPVFNAGADAMIRLRANNLIIAKLGIKSPLDKTNLLDGTLSADLAGTPDATLSSLRFSGWGIANNLSAVSGCPPLNVNLSINAALQRNLDLTIANMDAVVCGADLNAAAGNTTVNAAPPAAVSRLFELNVTSGRINLLTGKSALDVAVGGLRDPILELPLLRTRIKSSPRLAAFIAALSPLEVTAKTHLDYDPTAAAIDLGRTEAELYSQGRRLAAAELAPTTVSVAAAPFAAPLQAKLTIDELPLIALNDTALPGSPVFSAGALSAVIDAAIDPRHSTANFQATTSVANAAANIGERSIDAATLSAKLTGGFDRGQIDISNCALNLSLSGVPVLDAALLASFSTGGSAFGVDGEINSFNGLLLEKLNIAKFRMPLSAAGTFHLNCLGGCEFTYTGSFRAATKLPGKEKDHEINISGALDFAGGRDGAIAINSAGLDVSGDEGELGQLTVNGAIQPPATKDRAAKLFIKSDRFHAQSILDLLDDTGSDHDREPQFNFGSIPITADVELNNVTWQGNIRAQATGRMISHRDSLDFERFFIRLNGAEIRASGAIAGRGANGASYKFHAETDDAELATVFAPFLPQEADRFYAAVSTAKLDITGKSLTAKGFWDTQTGTLELDLAKVRLTHNLGGTMLGRVLLLPFSIIVNLQEFLPLTFDRITHLGEITGIFSRFYDNTGAVEFNDGLVSLRSADGRIHVDCFQLTGSPIRRFIFKGSFGLGSKRELQLESLVEVMSLLIPVRIVGTIDEPNVDYSGLAAEMFRLNAGSLVDTINPLN